MDLVVVKLNGSTEYNLQIMAMIIKTTTINYATVVAKYFGRVSLNLESLRFVHLLKTLVLVVKDFCLQVPLCCCLSISTQKS